MKQKISVITVVFNDVAHIRPTMESFFGQTWQEKEYIVIDGGSTDGTADVIREYADRLAYWCSEPDGGIYDAMNKGIDHASGEWINFLNCGDEYVGPQSLEQAMSAPGLNDADIVYGNSIERRPDGDVSMPASADTNLMRLMPIYRHGSSLVRATVHRQFRFDLSRSDLGFALDWHAIHQMYLAGKKFLKADCFIQCYELDGRSNHPQKTLRYNYKITAEGQGMAIAQKLFYAKTRLRIALQGTRLMAWFRGFFIEYMVNDVLPHIPFWTLRRWYLRRMHAVIGKRSFVMKRCYIISPNRLSIGEGSHINRGCLIDARGGLTIGNSVSVSHNVSIITGGHNMNSSHFEGRYLPIRIDDYTWIGANSTILQGVTIGRGAVVCAGAVVTKDVEPYAVVGGVPARKIKERRSELDYQCIWDSPFT